MTKPKQLIAPCGPLEIIGEFGYVCVQCGNAGVIPLLLSEETGCNVCNEWRKENLFCPSCRPDLYVWEDENNAEKVDASVDTGTMESRIDADHPTVEPVISAPLESKPIRFVGHLKGCWARDRYQDNEHCGCWRAIAEFCHEDISRGGAKNNAWFCHIDKRPSDIKNYDIVGLPDTKLRSDYD